MEVAPRSGTRAVGPSFDAPPSAPQAALRGQLQDLRDQNEMLRARLQDVEGQMLGLQQETARQTQEQERTWRQGTAAATDRVSQLERRLTDQEKRLAELDQARQKDLAQLQDRILSEFARLLQEQERRAPAARASSGGGRAAGEGEHRVEPGESLSTIARRHGTTVSRLLETNGLTNPDQIRAGQILRLP
jgi:nucleoid-associated protein YgaU